MYTVILISVLFQLRHDSEFNTLFFKDGKRRIGQWSVYSILLYSCLQTCTCTIVYTCSQGFQCKLKQLAGLNRLTNSLTRGMASSSKGSRGSLSKFLFVTIRVLNRRWHPAIDRRLLWNSQPLTLCLGHFSLLCFDTSGFAEEPPTLSVITSYLKIY